MKNPPGVNAILTAVLLVMAAILVVSVGGVVSKPGFPAVAPQVVALVGMAGTVAAILLEQLMEPDVPLQRVRPVRSGPWAVGLKTLGVTGTLLAAAGVLLDANLGAPGLVFSVKAGCLIALFVGSLILGLASLPIPGRTPSENLGRATRGVLRRLKPDKNTLRAVAVVLFAVPVFILAWVALNYVSSSGVVDDTDYLSAWGVVAAAASVVWLIAPLASKAFSRYERHFFIGGVLLSALGLLLSAASLLGDEFYVSGHLVFALALGALLAGSMIVSFALAGPWRDGSAPLRLARWAVERLSSEDKAALLRELNAAAPAPQVSAAPTDVKVGS